jgi:hypothetical protein
VDVADVRSLSQTPSPEPRYQERELGERYLRTYGVMQAFVIQQDAALNVHVSLGKPEPD